MKGYTRLLLSFSVCALSACSSDFKETKITAENQLKVISTVNAAKKVTKEDAKMFLVGTNQINRTEGSIVGHTVGEVIKIGSDFEKMGPPPAATSSAPPAAAPAPLTAK